MDPHQIDAEMRRAQAEFHQLITNASPDDLRRPTDGTRWTNRQLLFHMQFGYLIVRTLMPLVHAFGRRPASWSRRFTAILNAGQRPFHLINYLGSCGGGQLLPTSTMIRLMDRTIHSLQRKLAAEANENLALTMHFPAAWDPYFHDTMSVFEVYHYGTQHFDHHRKQLTLPHPSART